MESRRSTESAENVHIGDDVAIPIIVSEQESHTKMHWGHSKDAALSDSDRNKEFDGGSSSGSLRQRSSSRIMRSDSALAELHRTGAKYSKPKSRLMELEPSTLSSSSNLSRQSSILRISPSQRMETLATGSLPPAQMHNEDDEEGKEENEKDEKKDDKKVLSPVEKFRKKGTKLSLKAIDGVLEWIILVGFLALLVISTHVEELKIRVIWGLEIWKWCVLVVVFFCGRLVTKWAKDAIVLLIESKFLFNEKVVYFVHGVKQSVRVVIWLALVFLAWFLLVDQDAKYSKKTIKVLNYITRALAATLIGAVMWMLKTLLVKLIAASFHVKTFFDKIREAISHEYFLWALSLPRSTDSLDDRRAHGGLRSHWCFNIPKWMGRDENGEEIEAEKYQKLEKEKKTNKTYTLKEDEMTIKKLGKLKVGKMPVSTMGHLIDRIGSSKLSIISSALDGRVQDGGEQKEITSRSEAEEAASQIFKNVKRPDCDYIEVEDLEPFMNEENAECLVECFEKVAEEGKITETALKDWVVNIYKERECLSHSLRDAKTAIEELNRILSVVVVILIVIVWLLLMGFATTRVLLLFSSQLLVAGFIFGNTCRTLFEAMIFVFVMHPFDVGDRCVIDGVMMVVEEMDILKTAFLRYDFEMIYYPNAVLATKAISNYNRSPEKMGEMIDFDVDVSTSVKSIEALRAKIKEYIEGNSQYWHPDHSVHIREIENMNKMKMYLLVNHKMNFQNFLERLNRRTALMQELKQIFEDLSIKYHLLPQQIHVNHVR